MHNKSGHDVRGRVIHDSLRALQFTLAIIVAIIYGIDLQHASAIQARAHPSLVFAEVVAGLSALTSLLHCLFLVHRVVQGIWDFILAVLWAACFGSFAVYFLVGRELLKSRKMTSSSSRMKAGAWIDLVNTIGWFISAMSCCIFRKAVFQPIKSLDELQRTGPHMDDVELEGQPQDNKLERRWSGPPSYRSSVETEWKSIQGKTK